MEYQQTDRIVALEQQWYALASPPKESQALCRPRILSICGASGVGKTTVTRALAHTYNAYIEVVDDNPYLRDLLEGLPRFDAAANQRWFLQKIGDFVNRSNSEEPLVLDQDPAATVFAYARMYYDEGQIAGAQYADLVSRLIEIERRFHQWETPRLIAILHAPPEVLHHRVLGRSENVNVPPVAWFDKIQSYFRQLLARFPQAIEVSTAAASPEKVAVHLRDLLKHGRG